MYWYLTGSVVSAVVILLLTLRYGRGVLQEHYDSNHRELKTTTDLHFTYLGFSLLWVICIAVVSILWVVTIPALLIYLWVRPKKPKENKKVDSTRPRITYEDTIEAPNLDSFYETVAWDDEL